jgi:hypothetical protein
VKVVGGDVDLVKQNIAKLDTAAHTVFTIVAGGMNSAKEAYFLADSKRYMVIL